MQNLVSQMTKIYCVNIVYSWFLRLSTARGSGTGLVTVKKECLTTAKQVFFTLPTEGSFVDIRAYIPWWDYQPRDRY